MQKRDPKGCIPTWFHDYLMNLPEDKAKELSDWMDISTPSQTHYQIIESLVCFSPNRSFMVEKQKQFLLNKTTVK